MSETVTLDLPGFGPETLKIAIDDGYLTIDGETPTRVVHRTYRLPRGVEDVEAQLEHGVLTLELKRKAARQVPLACGGAPPKLAVAG